MQEKTAGPHKKKKSTPGPRSKNLPNLIIDRVVKELGINPNVMRISRVLGISQPMLWGYLNGKYPWRAEEWIKMMMIMGYFVESPTAFELHFPKIGPVCDIYDALFEFNPSDRSWFPKSHSEACETENEMMEVSNGREPSS